jgi:hypothetical protein
MLHEYNVIKIIIAHDLITVVLFHVVCQNESEAIASFAIELWQ